MAKLPDAPHETRPRGVDNPYRWLSLGAGTALLLALLALVLAWRHATDERRAAEDVKARVAAEMNRIEAEAKRMEREAAQ
jgi:hypothetical protein